MAPGRRVVITGVASHWGAELARRLERDPAVSYIAGIDSVAPAADLERTDFIEADIRNPMHVADPSRHRAPTPSSTAGSSGTPSRASRRARSTTST